jgi:uncharacterized repeat protein (TIGR01451 family)
MTRSGQRLCLLALAACLCGAASGCFGGTQNPSYFPYYLPFGDVIPTHAKPPWPGYYANFDPKAVRLIVQPLEATSQVRTQHVLLATVYDEKNTPRRARRVEWHLEGVGNIIEANEDGVMPGRGYPDGSRRAVTYTEYHEHRLTRGNANTADDIMVRPGQTWCVVSSPIEGDTHVTVVAPGVHDWDKRVTHAVIRWVDATWEFPPPAKVRSGTDHVLNTKVFRFTDRKPLERYEVRYKILDGPPAVFKQTGTQEYVARSDPSGNAFAVLTQTAPAPGINRIGIEVIRPPDPTTPSGAGVPIVRSETTVEWLAPNVVLAHSAPPIVALNQEFTITTSATNNGSVDSASLTINAPLPDGLEFVRSQPPAFRDGNALTWAFGVLGPGQAHTIQAVYKAQRAGDVRSVVLLTTGEGQKDTKEALIKVSTPQLGVTMDGPPSVAVGTPINFKVTLTNPGSGPLDEIYIVAKVPPNLEFQGKEHATLERKVAGLGAGQSRDEVLTLTPKQPGTYTIQLTATSTGLTAQAQRTVTVTQPQVSLDINGPQKRVVGRPAEWKITVRNPSPSALANVVVRDRLPSELEFQAAPQGGQYQNGEVVWNIGTLQPNEQRVLDLITLASRPAPLAEQRAEVVADGLRREARATIEIQGLAAITMNLTALNSPVEVGKPAVYRLEVINQGSAELKGVEVKATASEQLRPIKAQGPARETVAGRLVTFDALPAIQPGAKATYFIECQAEKQGDARLHVEVTSDANREPLVREEALRVIAPFLAPAPPVAPPPPPDGGAAQPLPPG